jgi:hypothetical protein
MPAVTGLQAFFARSRLRALLARAKLSARAKALKGVQISLQNTPPHLTQNGV